MAPDNSTIARHEARAQIERDLALGVPLQRIAKKYGVSKDAAWRHKKKLPPQLKQALLAGSLRPEVDLDKLRISEGEGLLANLAAQRARLLLMQDWAQETEQISIAAQISAQIHRNLELVGKYLGEFAQHHVTTSVSLLVSPEYLTLRTELLRALAPFPDARKAVADALGKIERKAAQPPALPAPEVTDG
jgi:hypothetical protein